MIPDEDDIDIDDDIDDTDDMICCQWVAIDAQSTFAAVGTLLLPPRTYAYIMYLCAYKRHINHHQTEKFAMRKPVILNDYTSAEIEAARVKLGSKRAERPCLWCEKVVSMRGDQHFCSAPCRAAYARAAAQIEAERRVIEKQHWLAERDELIREIQRLRAALGMAEFSPPQEPPAPKLT